MFIRLRSIIWLLVWATCASAHFCQPLWSQQQPDIVRFVPDDVVACLTMTGELEANANGTSLERWLAQLEIQDSLANIWDMIKDQMATSEPEAMSEIMAHFPQLVLKQPWAIWLENTDFEAPKLKMVFWLGDLENKVAETVKKITENSPEDFNELEINGQKFFSFPNGDNKTEFGIFENHFVVSFGEGELAQLIASRQSEAPKWFKEIQTELPLDRTLGIFTIDVQKIVASLPEPDSSDESWKAMQFDALQKVVGSFGYQGDETVSRVSLHLPKELSGFWKTFDVAPMEAADLKGVPDSTHFAVCLKLAPETIWNIFRDSADSQHDFEQFQQYINDQWGIDFEADVIQSFGDYFYLYQELSMVNPMAAGLMGFRIKSPEAFQEQLDQFAKSFEEATDDYGLEIQETSDGPLYQIIPLDPDMGMFFPGVSFQLIDNELLVGLDPKAIESHQRKANREGGKLSDTSRIKALFDPQSNAGPGQPIGVVYLDMKVLIETIYSVLPMFGGGMDGEFGMEALPSLEAMVNGVLPNIMAVYRTEKGLQIDERTTLPGLSINASVGAALMFPATARVRQAAQNATSMNNLKQFALAIHNYESAYSKFPRSYTSDDDGKPLLSWRVQVLPFLEQQELYDQFHHDEPWDSPHNKELIAKMPDIFKHPSLNLEEGKTVYLGVTGKDAIFRADKDLGFADIMDGTSNTLMIVEANSDHAVYWTQPSDFNVDEIEDLITALNRNARNGSIQFSLADGAVFSNENMTNEKLRKMATIDGGEVVDLYED